MGDQHDQEAVDLDSIQASLNDLVKAADATDVVKAYGGTSVEWSGHVDERGKVSGGGADSGDMGGLDNMMIGKMADVTVSALSDAGFDASQISAFMSAKQEDEGSEEDEEEDEDEMEGGMSARPSPTMKSQYGDDDEPMAKAMDTFRGDSDIAEAIDVSPFLEALTARTAETIDGVNERIAKSFARQTNINRATAAATYQIGQLVKGIAQVVQALDERLNLVERTPAQPKGHTQLAGGARPLHKSLPSEVGAGGGRLTKSDIVNTLSYMNLEKGIKEIGGRRTGDLAMSYEAGDVVDNTTVDAVRHFLAANPAEAETARSYR